jgi:hypothetical protein
MVTIAILAIAFSVEFFIRKKNNSFAIVGILLALILLAISFMLVMFY